MRNKTEREATVPLSGARHSLSVYRFGEREATAYVPDPPERYERISWSTNRSRATYVRLKCPLARHYNGATGQCIPLRQGKMLPHGMWARSKDLSLSLSLVLLSPPLRLAPHSFRLVGARDRICVVSCRCTRRRV